MSVQPSAEVSVLRRAGIFIAAWFIVYVSAVTSPDEILMGKLFSLPLLYPPLFSVECKPHDYATTG